MQAYILVSVQFGVFNSIHIWNKRVLWQFIVVVGGNLFLMFLQSEGKLNDWETDNASLTVLALCWWRRANSFTFLQGRIRRVYCCSNNCCGKAYRTVADHGNWWKAGLGCIHHRVNWLGGTGRGRGQGKHAGQMSQSHMPFISHCAWKNRSA